MKASCCRVANESTVCPFSVVQPIYVATKELAAKCLPVMSIYLLKLHGTTQRFMCNAKWNN